MAPDLPTRSTEQQSRQSRPRSARVIVSAALLGLFLALGWVLWTAGWNHGFDGRGGLSLARCEVGLDMAKPPREMLSVLLRSGDGRVVPTNQQEEIGMEATVEAPSAQTRKDYTSRPGALSRFFRMSRDGWKSKYKDLKATVKAYKNHLAHLTRSREQWRTRAERAGEQITTLARKQRCQEPTHGS